MGGTEWLSESIPGQPHVDYPVLINLPDSGFDCRRQQMDGFYADISDEARCQAFWVCHNKQQDGFLCPNGTVFNQRYLTCDWWFNVQCDESPQHFDLNRNISVVGTHISAQPAGMPAGASPRVHPVLTMLGDILKYPGVPPVPPSNSTAPSNKSAPTAPASQAATPSSSQQPYDFELDVANVFVVGGIPGIPPLDTQCGDHLQSKATDPTACSLNRQPTKGPKLTNKRHAKKSSAYIHKRPYKRDLGNTKTTKHLHRRKARDSFMVQAAKGLESATSMLSSRIPQVEQSAISQLHKRATSPSPAPAALPSALAEPPDQGAAANQAGPQPIVQTVDKIAFPLAANGGNLPKVEEDFKIQGMGGDGRATSIKDVMPSHFPVPGALKVMAASGKEVPYGSMASAPPSQTGSQQSPTGPAQENGGGRDYASISLAQDVDFGQGSKGGSGEGAAEDGARSGRSGSPNGQTAVSGFLASPVATAAQPPAPGNAAGLNDGSSAQDASAPSPPSQLQAGSLEQSKQGGPGESASAPAAEQSANVPTNQNTAPDPPPPLPPQGPPGETHPPGPSGGQLPSRPSQDLKGSEAKPSPSSGNSDLPAGEDDKSSMKSGPMSEEVIEETSNVKILLPYSSKTGNSDGSNGNLAGRLGMPSGASYMHGQPLAEVQPTSVQMLSGHEHEAVSASINQPTKNTVTNPTQFPSSETQTSINKTGSAPGNPYASSAPADDSSTGDISKLLDSDPTSQQTGSVPAGGGQFDSATGVVAHEGSSEITKELDSSSQFVQGEGQDTGSLASNIKVQEKKLGNKPAFSSLLDDPSALKKEMPSENFKVLQQPRRKPEQDGALIPGHKSVQIKSESVSRIIKNPSRHRSAISDPAGMDLPELLRPPSFASYLSRGGFSLDDSMLSYSPTPPPHPAISRIKGSIDMKSGSNMARAAGPPPPGAVADLPPSLDSRASDAAGSRVGSAAPQDGDLSARVSETLSMVDTILGPPPFKSRRSYKPGKPRQPYRNAEDMSLKSNSFGSRSRKRSSESEPLYSDLGLNLSVLISGSPNSTPPSSAGASANAMTSLGQPPPRQHVSENKEHIYVVKPSAARAPNEDEKSTFRVNLRPKEKPSSQEPKVEERVDIKM
ncbi:nascent polypeptide-associated complex subunit alpha, muscle-specific form-like [Pollicipes pollicipes]|uniref:nascent polypeptide-associated complex subunit alpha, muscle-specific form-like n=1 Tax=Pollicipes pollicipes TaxID=41117 RepID=UPI0018858425|nr:nascent polypeptide-associated complex subunit alpha, muscle-specific form-like [Pollicipes pollicipes]